MERHFKDDEHRKFAETCFAARHDANIYAAHYSPKLNRLALPPALVVSVLVTRSVTKRWR